MNKLYEAVIRRVIYITHPDTAIINDNYYKKYLNCGLYKPLMFEQLIEAIFKYRGGGRYCMGDWKESLPFDKQSKKLQLEFAQHLGIKL